MNFKISYEFNLKIHTSVLDSLKCTHAFLASLEDTEAFKSDDEETENNDFDLNISNLKSARVHVLLRG